MGLGVVHEAAREVPVASALDVVVVGSGPAGIAAALAAARNGARTALVERLGFLGGCITATMMDVVWLARTGNHRAVEGICTEVLHRLKEQGGLDGEPGYRAYVDSERFKLLADQLMLEAGVQLWLHTLGVGAVVDGGSLAGVIVESKSGRQALTARVVVDASGDGDVAARANAAFAMGRPGDGLVQPVSTSFRLSNVNLAEMRAYYAEHPDDIFFARLVKQARAQGDFGIARNSVCFHGVRAWGELTGVNATRVFVKDPTDAVELTAAEVEARRQVYEVAAFLRKYVPGFANSEVSSIATQIAARESRRILGEYVLTEADVVSGAVFPDAIAKFPCYIDLHDPQGSNCRAVFPKPDRPGENPIDLAWQSGDPHSVFETQTRPARLPRQQDDNVEIAGAAVFDIPYRSLVPATLDGLLTAGRCISADHGAVASVRYLPASFATGQAAGTAAAMAALGNVRPRDLSVPALRKRLVEQGAYLGEEV